MQISNLNTSESLIKRISYASYIYTENYIEAVGFKLTAVLVYHFSNMYRQRCPSKACRQILLHNVLVCKFKCYWTATDSTTRSITLPFLQSSNFNYSVSTIRSSLVTLSNKSFIRYDFYEKAVTFKPYQVKSFSQDVISPHHFDAWWPSPKWWPSPSLWPPSTTSSESSW